MKRHCREIRVHVGCEESGADGPDRAENSYNSSTSLSHRRVSEAVSFTDTKRANC